MSELLTYFLVILNLVLIESLLSIDNAAVLAVMVKKLPKDKQNKALTYGLLGAYLFRGACLFFASILIKIWWLKPIGGLYLVYLFYSWYREKYSKIEAAETWLSKFQLLVSKYHLTKEYFVMAVLAVSISALTDVWWIDVLCMLSLTQPFFVWWQKSIPAKEGARKTIDEFLLFSSSFVKGGFICLSSLLLKIYWLQIFGILYIIYPFYFKWQRENDITLTKVKDGFNLYLEETIGVFWSAVILIELVDLTFSIDNVFAAVALTSNIYIICLGVFIGIAAMRFVAQKFINLMESYPALEKSAYTVVGLLGIKLCLSIFETQLPFLSNHYADSVFSVIVLAVFCWPVLFGSKQVKEVVS